MGFAMGPLAGKTKGRREQAIDRERHNLMRGVIGGISG